MIASAIVMMCQTLSGINIFAFLYSSFFINVKFNNDHDTSVNEQAKALRFGIGFGVMNFVFSVPAFFLVESNDRFRMNHPILGRMRGRRFLLLVSLGGGVFTLMATALAYAYMGENNPNRQGTVLAFILLFTVFYGPGMSTRFRSHDNANAVKDVVRCRFCTAMRSGETS